jgi:6-phosphogluconolactonase
MQLIVCSDLQELSRRAAELFVELAGQAISLRGCFAVALSGGSTPRALYSLLAEELFQDRVSWSKVHFFWGDERCVPPDHPQSNFRMAHDALLARIPAPPENIHRITTELEDPNQAAARYEDSLRHFFAARTPRFDLILLGMGEDGHVASLFANSLALKEENRLVVATYIKKLEAHRITFTFPLINAAANVVFLIAGQSKSHALQELLQLQRGTLPAEKVRPADGRLILLADQSATSALGE